MKQRWRGLILSVIGICMVVIASVSWHSVEEIHYLKSFYPKQFTVEEAFYASGVELIKVILVGLPLFLVIGIGLYCLWCFKREVQS
ncbi:MAG TPA: hypothetical protein VGB26_05520 [Nitrospiria bacterium]|jgi:hypothetical protein